MAEFDGAYQERTMFIRRSIRMSVGIARESRLGLRAAGAAREQGALYPYGKTYAQTLGEQY